CSYAAAAIVILAPSIAAVAQAPNPTPANPWFQAAPLPEPSEEVLGTAVNGKLYGFSGLGPGFRPRALVYEYDPASNAWAKKSPSRPTSPHFPSAPSTNKTYPSAASVRPNQGPPAGIPFNNAWEYDPAKTNGKTLAPTRTKRGA